MFEKLMQERNGEMKITKITRPLTYWLMVISFLILLFLNSFGYIKTDITYIEILKQLMMVMTVFYFGGRTVEKSISIAKTKEIDENGKVIYKENTDILSGVPNPDKL